MANFYCPVCRNGLEGTETQCPKCKSALTPAIVAPTAPAAAATNVQVRRYPSVAQFQAESIVMAAHGWAPVTQAEATGSFPTAASLLAFIGLLVVFVVSTLIGILIMVLAIFIGFVSRPKEYVVTYRHDPA